MKIDDEIKGMELALRVLKEKLDELIVKRNLAILAESPYMRQRKTKKLAEFFGELGYRILDLNAKEAETPEYEMSKLIWQTRAISVKFIKEFVKRDLKQESRLSFKGLSESVKADFKKLCKKFLEAGWMTYTYNVNDLSFVRCKSPGDIPFMTGGWAEYFNRSLVQETLTTFAQKHSCPSGVFQNVKLVRLGKESDQPDMELDVVAEFKDNFFVFETKSGSNLGLDKWVDRTRLFENTERAQFITCCTDESYQSRTFKPLKLWHMSSLQANFEHELTILLG